MAPITFVIFNLSIQMVVKRAREMLSSMTQDADQAPILCNAILVDNFLWTFRRKHAEIIDQTVPMHRTRCIFY